MSDIRNLFPILFLIAAVSLMGCTNSSGPVGDVEPPTVEVVLSIEEIETNCPYWFHLRANPHGSSDNESDVSELKIRWDYFNDGEWDGDYVRLDNKYYQFLEPPLEDVWGLRCEIQDEAGNSRIWTGSIDLPLEDWPASPDIVASFIFIIPQDMANTSVDTMVIGEEYLIRAHRRAWMPASEQLLELEFYIDDTLIHTGTDHLLSGMDSCIGIGWPVPSEFMTVGTHEFYVVFDSSDVVAESDESNNTIHRTVVVVE